MAFERYITDWDDAYANGPNIPGGDRWPQAWSEAAVPFRVAMLAAGRAELDIAYGEGPRNRFDLFLPERAPRGLFIFIHGGFWTKLDKSFWSHLSEGALARGMAVAMPSYTLCPQIRIAGIGEEIARAVEAAADRIDGPIWLSGHSAGGHLATRMVTETTPLAENVGERIKTVLSISGVHDLRPIMRTGMNGQLLLDEAEAAAESPALLAPRAGTRLICWVGAAERAEFVRQNALLANVWTGLGARTVAVEEPDRHHFDVIDGLKSPHHPMLDALLTDRS